MEEVVWVEVAIDAVAVIGNNTQLISCGQPDEFLDIKTPMSPFDDLTAKIRGFAKTAKIILFQDFI